MVIEPVLDSAGRCGLYSLKTGVDVADSLGFLMSLLGWSNLTMLPVLARDYLGTGADGLGYLPAAGAIGSLASTMFIAGLGDYGDKVKLVKFAGIATTVGILLFSMSRVYALSLGLAALMQAGLMAFEVSLTASVILLTSEKMQGRVQGIYTQVFGFTWIGGVILGSIATFIGAAGDSARRNRDWWSFADLCADGQHKNQRRVSNWSLRGNTFGLMNNLSNQKYCCRGRRHRDTNGSK